MLATDTNTQHIDLMLWQQVMQDLQIEYGDSIFDSWFSQLIFIESRAGEILVSAPSRFVKEWIESNYQDVIVNALAKYTTKVERLVIVLRNAIMNIQAAAANDSATKKESDQLFELQLDPKMTLENFVVGEANKAAYNAAQLLVANKMPGNILFVQGQVGMGKTHLLQGLARSIREKQPDLQVAYFSADQFMHMYISAIRKNSLVDLQAKLRTLNVLLIDDIQFICGKNATQQELGQTLSQLVESNQKVIISSDVSPYNLNLDQRTKSRLIASLSVQLKSPEYQLRLDILHSKASQLQADVSAEVMSFIAEQINSSVRELEGAFARLVYMAALEGYATIDMHFAHQTLQESFDANQQQMTSDQVIDAVASFYQITPGEIRSKNRARRFSHPRQVAAFVAKQLTSDSLQDIGYRLGGKDHATVIYSVKKLEEKQQKDDVFAKEVQKVMLYVQDRK